MTGGPGSRLRRFATATGLVLGGVALALLLMELAVRLFWDLAQPATERDSKQPTPAQEAAARDLDPDLPELESLFELSQRSVDGVHKGLPFRTNAAGFRGPEVSRRPAPGVFRILVAGDSVTMGTGVLLPETYAARLERALNAESTGTRYEVLNIGLSGLNTRWVVDRVARTGMNHHPHLVIYGYTLNDIEGPDYVSTIEKGSVPAKMMRSRRFAKSRSYLLRAVWPRLLALQEIVFTPRGSLEHDLRFNYGENAAAWAQVTDGLDRLARITRKRGLCSHVLIHTGIAQLNRLYPFLDIMEQVENAARERGFTVTQTFPFYEGRDPTKLRLSYFDSHPNADGHEILATALLQGLRELPERCWAAGPGGVPEALRTALP